MVTTLLNVLLVSLGIVFLWGFLAPRSLWRALSSWSYGDPHLGEPTGIGYGLYRVVSVIGIVAMIVSGVLVARVHEGEKPPPPVEASVAEKLWGAPDPVVVNRVIQPVNQAPAGLVNQPILGYQDMDGKTRQPPYLFSLKHFDIPEAIPANGYFGEQPSVGLVALDTAQLVVRVSGDPQCFPHAAMVAQSDETVRVAIYYGRAMPNSAKPPANLADCSVLASSRNISTLIPIQLVEPLGKRTVTTFDGTPILRVGPEA